MVENTDTTWYARIRWVETEEDEGGAIELQADRVWRRIEGHDVFDLYARHANLMSRPPLYAYSLSDGPYGGLLAKQVAAELQGEPEYAPAPILPEGCIA